MSELDANSRIIALVLIKHGMSFDEAFAAAAEIFEELRPERVHQICGSQIKQTPQEPTLDGHEIHMAVDCTAWRRQRPFHSRCADL